jgi:hypothetical protein
MVLKPMLPRLIDLAMWKNWLIIQKFLNELYDAWQSRTKERKLRGNAEATYQSVL